MENEALAAEGATADRSAEADAVIRRHTIYAAIGGAIPLPLVEIGAAATIQLRMVAQLCDVYGLRFSENAVKAAIGTLVATALPSTTLGYATASVIRGIPLLGPIVGVVMGPVFYGAVTWALGRVFAWHFAKGGKIEDFDAGSMKDRFKAEFEEGRRKAGEFIAGTKAKPAAAKT